MLNNPQFLVRLDDFTTPTKINLPILKMCEKILHKMSSGIILVALFCKDFTMI